MYDKHDEQNVLLDKIMRQQGNSSILTLANMARKGEKSMSKIYVGVLNYRNSSFKQFLVEFDNESDFNIEDWLNENEDITGYRETDCYWISSREPINISEIINIKF